MRARQADGGSKYSLIAKLMEATDPPESLSLVSFIFFIFYLFCLSSVLSFSRVILSGRKAWVGLKEVHDSLRESTGLPPPRSSTLAALE